MKKQFFIPACLLAIAAIGFVLYALEHPELSFPWNVQMTHIIYGVYVDIVVLLFVLALCLNALQKKRNGKINISGEINKNF